MAKTPALEKYTGITHIFTYFISTNTQCTLIATYAKFNRKTKCDNL
jgi:gamma-glutamyl phosphate reductase